uniref:Uncharacterized protein n=1 Tax=Alexandrium catenella TaxID=2925 RepID=A0A7S1MNR4_ALECA|mmetsp:Transcript_29949/g.81172  ORF Transcript_29949/g.81172 Transcript_29949/m.81172 type:complete len:402 (+) Transcript_29949:80-1285(+)
MLPSRPGPSALVCRLLPLLGLCLLRVTGLRLEPTERRGPVPMRREDGSKIEGMTYNAALRPSGPRVEPEGRHIQVLNIDPPKGLTDRIKFFFRPLVALGVLHNATVHILGGSRGPKLWLAQKHTAEIADDWGRYFDLSANGGNPWNELVNFRGCKVVSHHLSEQEWTGIFNDGSLCVNVESSFKAGLLELQWLAPRLRVDVSASALILDEASSFLRRYSVEQAYGSVHIRRCDRINGNEDCTSVDRIYQEIAGNDRFSAWLLFMYAEEGYRQALRERLEPLGRKLLFEDDVALTTRFPKDNYFVYLLSLYLHVGAAALVETHICGKGGNAAVYNHSVAIRHNLSALQGMWLARSSGRERPADAAHWRTSSYLEVEENYEAVCSSKDGKAGLRGRMKTLGAG